MNPGVSGGAVGTVGVAEDDELGAIGPGGGPY